MSRPSITIKHGYLLEEAIEKVVKDFDPSFTAPPTGKTLNNISEYKKEWELIQEKVLGGIAEVLGINFTEQNIDVYISGIMYGGFSDPLTISARTESKRFPDVLTHELIHRIFIHNEMYPLSVISEARKSMHPNEKDSNTVIHVVLHAIHKYLYLEVLQEPERLEREMLHLREVGATSYLRAWEIVETEGYKEIIQKFKSSCAALVH
jgi:hypothetical protein